MREPCEHGRYESHPNISHGTKPVEANCPGGRVVEATRMDWCNAHKAPLGAKVPEVCLYWLWMMSAGFEDEFFGECVRSSVLIVEEQQCSGGNASVVG